METPWSSTKLPRYPRLEEQLYADAAVIGGCGIPVAMIFIANQNGSHNPYEEMQMKDFMIGTDLLWHTVKAYD